MHSRICHNMVQLFEVIARNRQWPQGTAQWRRHLWWVLWLRAWAQFSHQKGLCQAWSCKSLFIQFANKYTLTMNYAKIGRIERSTLMLYTRGVDIAGNTQDQRQGRLEVGTLVGLCPCSWMGMTRRHQRSILDRSFFARPCYEFAGPSSLPLYSSFTLTPMGLILTDNSMSRSFCSALSPEHQTYISIYLVCNLFFIFCWGITYVE